MPVPQRNKYFDIIQLGLLIRVHGRVQMNKKLLKNGIEYFEISPVNNIGMSALLFSIRVL